MILIAFRNRHILTFLTPENVRALCRSRVRTTLCVQDDAGTDSMRCSFPPGVFNCVVSEGSVGGAALSAHLDVDKVRAVDLKPSTADDVHARSLGGVHWLNDHWTENHGGRRYK